MNHRLPRPWCARCLPRPKEPRGVLASELSTMAAWCVCDLRHIKHTPVNPPLNKLMGAIPESAQLRSVLFKLVRWSISISVSIAVAIAFPTSQIAMPTHSSVALQATCLQRGLMWMGKLPTFKSSRTSSPTIAAVTTSYERDPRSAAPMLLQIDRSPQYTGRRASRVFFGQC